MKTETIITAIIFVSVGFLGGFAYRSHRDSSTTVQVQAPVENSADQNANSPMDTGTPALEAMKLPKGHPPLQEAEVIQQYEKRAEQDPKNPQLALQLANYLYDKQLYNLAIEWYQKALALQPDDANARTDLGTAYFYSGNPQQAIEEYNKVLARVPNHQATIFNLVIVNAEGTHDLKAARKYWNQLYRLNPNYPGLEKVKSEVLGAASSDISRSPSR